MYHFTDGLTKDMREGRGWYAGWDVGRRLLFITLFYAAVYIDSFLVSVSMPLTFYIQNVNEVFAEPNEPTCLAHRCFEQS